MIGRKRTPDASTIDRLERRVAELELELRRRTAALPPDRPGWDGDAEGAESAPGPVSHAWISILDPPLRRRPRLPRLPFEILFLSACAVAAGIANLEPLWIAAVMGAAWLLVALADWSATLADRRRAEASAAPPPRMVAVAAGKPDHAWFIPPVERTMTEGMHAGAVDRTMTDGMRADSDTAVTRLPQRSLADLEATIERRAADTQAS